MTSCPICRRDALSLAVAPELDITERALISRVNPAWHSSDGICPRCVAAFRESARRLREREAKQVGADGFRQYRRFTLSRRESREWNHVNEILASWHRWRILKRIGESAERDGCNAWLLFDSGETLLAQSADVTEQK